PRARAPFPTRRSSDLEARELRVEHGPHAAPRGSHVSPSCALALANGNRVTGIAAASPRTRSDDEYDGDREETQSHRRSIAHATSDRKSTRLNSSHQII